MAQTDIPPQLILPKTKYKVIRNGSVGILFQISNELAAKILFTGDIFTDTEHFVLRQDKKSIEELEHEYDVNVQLYKRELFVPKPVGIERLALFNTSYPAFIMQYLPFPSGSDLGYHEFYKAESLLIEELGKASDLGFKPGGDCRNPNNYLYDRNNKRVYLIDFGRWSFDTDYKYIFENGDN